MPNSTLTTKTFLGIQFLNTNLACHMVHLPIYFNYMLNHGNLVGPKCPINVKLHFPFTFPLLDGHSLEFKIPTSTKYVLASTKALGTRISPILKFNKDARGTSEAR
jgi:hypothetical protein